MSTAIVPQQQAVAQWKSPSAVKDRINAIQKLMKQVLKPASKESGWDGDYGIIPGTGTKPSLLKAGSEQILAMFEIAVEPVVEDLSTEDCRRYRVTCRLIHAPSGNFLGAGIGECSTDETKYKWKRTYSVKEYNETDSDRRKMKYSSYNGVDKEEMLVRTEPADLGNTVLKMAKKRAQIDATLTVTGASSMFTQDLEEDADGESKPVKTPPPPVGNVKCTECNAIGGHLPKCSKRQQQAPKEEPTMCSSCGKTGTHEPTCKYAVKVVEGEVVTDLKRGVFLILQVEDLLKKVDPKKPTAPRTPYQRLTVVDASNAEMKMYVWHETPQPYLRGVSDKNILCEYKSGKDYASLENILELNGVKFVDNKPA